MTRGNLNFVWQNQGEAPRTLFHYHNGEQYPEGLLQFFGIEEFLLLPTLWTPEDFRTWIRKNYRVACRKRTTLANGMILDAHAETNESAEPEDLGEGAQPRIYYTEGFVTDYSYVFTHEPVRGRKWKDGIVHYRSQNWVTTWEWKKMLFDGSAKSFLKFLQKRVKPAALPPDVGAFSAVASALAAVPAQPGNP